ncbi:Sec-independent protein translocase protein TatB [Hyphomicrobium sp.]|jgi:sec-independent protein translocase protein TatB|uniref:Sec-independent protein translocase protein TatB n=1 Tax=Hyphomicrobium sp. TaxID=82 RepID=UPI003561AF0D
MFDISWSELLILGIVTLVFVGPKELPVFLRTLGRYAGMARRHANEFKAQFDAAMREAELDSMRKEVAQMQSSINSEVMKVKSTIDEAGAAAKIEPPVTPSSVPQSQQPAELQQEAASALPSPPLPAPPSAAPPSEMAPPAVAKTES